MHHCKCHFLHNAAMHAHSATVMPPTLPRADEFFGKPELQEQVHKALHPTQCAAGCLAIRLPDPPKFALPHVVNISKDGRIAAVGGKDVELFLWSTETGELLSTLRNHETSWTSSNDNTFFVTTTEDSKVRGWPRARVLARPACHAG